MDTTQVTTTIINMNWYYWIIYAIVAVLGAIASSLVVNKGNLILPHVKDVPDTNADINNPSNIDNSPTQNNAQSPNSTNNKSFFEKAQDMGFCSDLIVGLAAAFAIFWAMTPQTLFQLIGIAAVAGYGGSTILQSLVNKVKADTLTTENEKKTLENNNLKTENMINELEKNKEAIKDGQQELAMADLAVAMAKIIKGEE